MNHWSDAPFTPGRIFGAWVCLVAVVLLWSPMLAAAWQTGGMACCEGGMCGVHAHVKTNHSRAQHNQHMNCEHHGGTETADCSMSCGQGSHSLTSAVIFVLPAPAIFSQPARPIAASSAFVPAEFVRSFEPLSPPPRPSFSSL